MMNVLNLKKSDMKRDIRFKAKRLDNGELCEGSLFVGELPNGAEYALIERNNEEPIEVDPTTVCQYTGRNAENDVPIYEGDIVECTYFNEQGDDTHCTGTVAWEQDVWGFVLKNYMFDNLSVGNRYRGEEYIGLPCTDDTESIIKVLYSKFDKEVQKDEIHN